MAPDELFSLPFSTPALDRAGDRRKDAKWLAEAAADPSSLVLVLRDGATVPIQGGGLLWSPAGAVVDTSPQDWIFLGIDDAGRALFASEGAPKESVTYATLRDLGPTLGLQDADAAVEAVALYTWHRRHHFCAMCGAPTAPAEGGHTRHCESCGTDHFPRTDPAVIMLVSDGDRCVLGRRIGAPEGRWSTLAGFVEPGETPEGAVAREVHEEVGLDVVSVRYRGAQPWPFPSSLMLAYEATAAHGPLVINDEHHEVRWFTRGELATGMADGSLTLPGPVSAGHALIRSWLA